MTIFALALFLVSVALAQPPPPSHFVPWTTAPLGWTCVPLSIASTVEQVPVFFSVLPTINATTCLGAYDQSTAAAPSGTITILTNLTPNPAVPCKGAKTGDFFPACTLTKTAVDKLAADLKVDKLSIPKEELAKIKFTAESDFVKICVECP